MIALKVALVVFLVLAVTFIVVVFIRRVRANGLHVRQSSSHFHQMYGAMPKTPKPGWVTETGDDHPGDRRP